jgi:hypothetical protein
MSVKVGGKKLSGGAASGFSKTSNLVLSSQKVASSNSQPTKSSNPNPVSVKNEPSQSNVLSNIFNKIISLFKR